MTYRMDDGDWEEASLADVARLLADWRVVLCMAASAAFWACVLACLVGSAPFGLASLLRFSGPILALAPAMVAVVEGAFCR